MGNINIEALLAIVAKQLATSNMCLAVLAEMKAKSEGQEFNDVFNTLHTEINKAAIEYLKAIKSGESQKLSSLTIDDLLR